MIKKTLSLIFITLFGALKVSAIDINDFIKPVNPLEQNNTTIEEKIEISVPQKTTLTKNDIHNQYAIALNRYIQSNVKSSYTDFNIILESSTPNDYMYIKMSEKMADLGFFTLSDEAMSKISDNEISQFIIEDIKRFYFPSVSLSKEDEIYLAEMYSNIIYNEQSLEVITELTKNKNLLDKYDYANYIAALGYLKSNDIENAEKYINIAIDRNQKNLNYKRLKAEILSQSKKPQSALKMVNTIKSQPFHTTIFKNKAKSIEEYILYKTEKNEFDKKYHLAFYFYMENELSKSMRTLQTAFNTQKKHNKDVYALLAKVYYDMKEYEKAQDNALKATTLDSNNKTAWLVLGDISFQNRNYKNASNYYKKANCKEGEIKLAKCLILSDKTDKGKELLQKTLKNNPDAYEAYYNLALLDKPKEIEYLKKSVAINCDFKDGWIDLARTEIENNKLDNAISYLNIAKYIDENDYRYYYYLGLVYKNQGLTADAKRSFMKSFKLNPDYIPTKKELSI